METAAFLVGNRRAGAGMIALVKTIFLALGIGLTSVLSGLGEENSAQRLENAQQGMAEGSWPRKPDNRLSPLSGKMKESQVISMRYYGQEKEFRAKSADEWMKEAAWGREVSWKGASARRWEESRWEQGRDRVSGQVQNERFQPGRELAKEQTLVYREVEQKSATDWASRSARLGSVRDGSLRMYDGRLTRVREQLWEEQPKERELGPGRQEKFSPQEVERMLADPLGQARGAVREQSPAASPLAAADN